VNEIVRVGFRYNDWRLFARLVTLVRGGDSAHCEVAGQWDGDVYTCVSASMQDGGVRIKEMRMPPDKWRIYEIAAQLDPIEYGLRNLHLKYDYLGLLGIVWPLIGHARKRKFCTEVAGEIIGLSEPHLFDLRMLESVCATYGERIQ